MIGRLIERIFDELVDSEVSESTIDLALAALDGDDLLDAYLKGAPAPARPTSAGHRAEPTGAFLTAIKVEGFRGIGRSAVLTLPPGPGLTVVTGRNGSGKSSFAEALEFALTRDTYRRKHDNSDFKVGWRNIHQPSPCQIDITLYEEVAGESHVIVNWAPTVADAAAADFRYQVAGGRQRSGADVLGWESALQTFRPLLSYEELGQILTTRPSALHDAIANVLGLADLEAAIARIAARVKPLTTPLTRSSTERKLLRTELSVVADHRAHQAAGLLARSSPDLSALRALAAGTAGSPGQHALTRIAAVQLPGRAEVMAAAERLDSALVALSAIGTERTSLDRLRDSLLTEALSYHAEAGADVECPVCGAGRLDDDWRRRTETAVQAVDLLTEARRDAESELRAAETAAQSLLRDPPAASTQTEVMLASQETVNKRWRAWRSPASQETLAQHLRNQFDDLRTAVTEWQAEAQAKADDMAGIWEPLAARIGAWVTGHEHARTQAATADRLKACHEQLRLVELTLREERMQPIVEQAKAIWAELRHESNVELHDIALKGTGNRRAVDINAAVDDEATSAISVMSQGELHALALALFLPRATADQSPFRFLVLDDPVQAMDPSKVEGLTAVLADLARTRQVVVFSHDDRLAQACRRLPQRPTILEVRRDRRSEVQVRESLSPTQAHLSDAHAVRKDDGLDDAVRRRILPGVLRQALEAALWDRYTGERLRRGDPLADVEESWAAATTTRARLELVLGKPPAGWLDRDPARKRALGHCASGMHKPLTGNLDEAVADVQLTVRGVEQRLP